MEKISILTKSYIGDINYCKRLFLSFTKHNKDNLKLYLVVPEKDLIDFKKIIHDDNIIIMSENLLSHYLTQEPINDIRPGYINQEIIKLSFWELNMCENYFCCDSDGYFIRDFFISDFLDEDGIPYTILIEDKELQVDPYYYNTYWKGRSALIEKIKKSIGFNKPYTLTNHGNSVFSAKVLNEFTNDFMNKNNYSYIDLMKISPYEFSWYNIWLQHSKTIPIIHREPLFKVFHYADQHLEYILKNVSENDIARGYIGIIINSNYSRGFGTISMQDNKSKVIANYLTLHQLFEVIYFKSIILVKKIFKKIQSNF